jgi:hypothetical protein
VNRCFWDTERGLYRERESPADPFATQLTQALMLLSGHAPRPQESALAAALGNPDLLTPELYLQHVVLRALVRGGHADQALARVRELWMPMIRAGSPTIWEAAVHQKGKAAFDNSGSLCHGFATAPIDLLQGTLLGVRPLEPGFSRFGVAPHALGLDWACGAVPTPRGLIRIEWRRHPATDADPSRPLLFLRLDVPEGTVACLPGNDTRLGTGSHDLVVADNTQASP